MAFVPVVLSLIGPIDDHNDDDDEFEHGGKGSVSAYSSRRGSSTMVSVGAQTAHTGLHAQHRLAHGEDGDLEEFHTPSKQASKWNEGAPRLL
jgi:hypothetical protein